MKNPLLEALEKNLDAELTEICSTLLRSKLKAMTGETAVKAFTYKQTRRPSIEPKKENWQYRGPSKGVIQEAMSRFNTNQELADHFKVDKSTIYNWFRKFRLNRKSRTPHRQRINPKNSGNHKVTG